MIKTFTYLTVFLLVSCKPTVYSLYKSKCYLYGESELILTLREDKTFNYEFRYYDEVIKGNWLVKKDTLILKSDRFEQTLDSFNPKIKNSDIDKLDKYLIKGKKLFILNKDGETNKCYLKSQ